MMRISFCVSLVVLALLPNLFAIMDDDQYVYVDDDVSIFSLYWKILIGSLRLKFQHQHKLELFQPSHQLLRPLQIQIATAVSFKIGPT